MTHWSENSKPLTIQYVRIQDPVELSSQTQESDVSVLVLPPSVVEHRLEDLNSILAILVTNTSPTSTLIVLGQTSDLVHVHSILGRTMRFQLWIAIKSFSTPHTTYTALPNCHFGALIYTKYRSSLRHTKTRVPYTFCPICDRTTKDYGGKKHTYHEYGTLISDVWRDIQCDLNGDISPVIDRFSDMFGLPTYTHLTVLDCRSLPLFSQVCSPPTLPNSVVNNNPLPPHLSDKLLLGDCIERLRELPDNSVDFAFADPPYNLGKHYSGYADDLDAQKYFDWCDQWLLQLARVLRPGRTCVVLNIPLFAMRHYLFMESILNFQNWIVWDALAFPVRLVMPAHYALLCFSKGRPRSLPGFQSDTRFGNITDIPFLQSLGQNYCLRIDCVRTRRRMHINDKEPLTDLWSDIHRLKHNTRRVDHPCQLPPQLMYRLISLFTFPGETVMDCFNGAGTTTLAAAQLSRTYVGIELSEQYHNLATTRHNELLGGLDPFRKASRILTAKNSPVPRMPKQEYVVSKRTLQLEVRRIAQFLGRIPSRDEVSIHSKYPIQYYDDYFVSWGEVCAAARTTGMSEFRNTVYKKFPVSQSSFLD